MALIWQLSPLIFCILRAQAQDFLGYYPEGGLYSDYGGVYSGPGYGEEFPEGNEVGFGGNQNQDEDEFDKSRGRRETGSEGEAATGGVLVDEVLRDQDIEGVYSQQDVVPTGVLASNRSYLYDLFSEDTPQDEVQTPTGLEDEKREEKAETKKDELLNFEGLLEEEKGEKKDDEDGERRKRLAGGLWSSELADEDMGLGFGYENLLRKKRSPPSFGGASQGVRPRRHRGYSRIITRPQHPRSFRSHHVPAFNPDHRRKN